MSFVKISVNDLNENFFNSIGKEWMLVTAGDKSKFNMMTASWGFTGVMWNKPCVIAAIRPQRYTKQFVDESDYYTLSFYGDNKEIHSVCGKLSGRDVDKVAKTGLTPVFDDDTETVFFKEARLVLICRKICVTKLESGNFLSSDIPKSIYPLNDYHTMYYGEIVSVLKKC